MERQQQLLFVLMLVKIVCTCPHGELRLVNTTVSYEGRLEICVAGKWNGVCASRPSTQEATVACRQLGCANGYSYTEPCSEDRFKFDCVGHETKLLECVILNSTDTCIGVNCTLCQTEGLLPYGDIVDTRVPKLDDGSSGHITLHQSFPFFGSNESAIYVNTNGIVSFQDQEARYSPRALPFSFAPLIIPFMRDVDIRNGGEIYYREARDSETLNQANSLVFNYTRSNFYPVSVFIATWSEVRQFGTQGNESNTFQTVLMTDGSLSYVGFLYEDIQWGPGALVGFDAGDLNRSFTVPGGLTEQTLNLEYLSNIGRPGVFIYQVNGNEVTPPNRVIHSPTLLRTGHISTNSIQLNWLHTVSTQEVVQFNLYCYYQSCPYCSHLPILDRVETTSLTDTVYGLTPYTEYACCVTASIANQESDCEREISVRTRAVPPSAPLEAQVNDVTSTSAHFEWSTPQYTNGTITHYTIACSGGTQYLTYDVQTAVQNVDMLRPYTNYTCCISATNTAGEGDRVCVTTRTDSVPPTKPQDIATIHLASTSVTLSWQEPADTYGLAIQSYIVNCSSVSHQVGVEGDHNTTLKVTGLNTHTNYTCCISARSSIGTGSEQCTQVQTKEAEGNVDSILVSAVSGGVLLAVFVLFIVVVVILIICCCRKKKKYRVDEHIYDCPDPDNKLNKMEMQPVPTAQAGNEDRANDRYTTATNPTNKSGPSKHRGDYKEKVQLKQDKPVKPVSADKRNKQPLMPKKQNMYNPACKETAPEDHYINNSMITAAQRAPGQGPQTTTQEAERIYQPLVPPKSYKQGYQEPSAEYHDLTFGGTSNKSTSAPVNTSEDDYEIPVIPKDTDDYEPVSFVTDTDSKHAPEPESQYQALAKLEQAGVYQPLSFGQTTKT